MTGTTVDTYFKIGLPINSFQIEYAHLIYSEQVKAQTIFLYKYFITGTKVSQKCISLQVEMHNIYTLSVCILNIQLYLYTHTYYE